MPPSILTPTLDTLNILQNQRVIDMSDMIHQLDPAATALTTLLMQLGKETTHSPKWEWLTDEYRPLDDQVNGAQTNVETAIEVDNGSYFRAGDVVQNRRTLEIFFVQSVAANVLTTVRGWGAAGAGVAMNDNDILLIIGNAMPEGSTKPTMITTKLANEYNFTEIFREPVSVTRTENMTKQYGGGQSLAYLRRKHGIEHMLQIERAFWWGERVEDNSTLVTSGTVRTPGGPGVRRSTRGIWNFLNGTAGATQDGAGATLDEAMLDTFCESVFRFGSDTKFAFTSALGLSRLNSIAKGANGSKIQMFPEDQVYGIRVFTYVSPHGTLKFVLNRLFTGADAVNKRWGGWLFALDMNEIKMRVFNGADTQLLLNRQANDEDGQTDEYLTECGLELKHPRKHGYLYNWI